MENYNNNSNFERQSYKKDLNNTYRGQNNSNTFKNMSDDYETPRWLMNIIIEKFNVKVDIAGDSINSKIKGSPLYDRSFNALDENWNQFKGTKFCYPPFTRPLFKHFLEKAHHEWSKGESSLVIVPLKTIAVDYFQHIKSPLIYIVYPRINFIYNGEETSYADSICLLHYDSEVKSFVLPEIKLLDLKNL